MRSRHPALLAAVIACTSTGALAQPPCLSSFATPAGQTAVPNASWDPPVVPSSTCVALNTSTTAGSPVATVVGCNAVLVGSPVTGPNFPPGTTVVSTNCTSVTFSQPATGTGSALHDYTLPAYANTYPPQNAGIPSGVNCCVCPATFSVNMCAGQYFTYQMCVGHAFTISMCGAATTWDSYLAITAASGTVLATGSISYDDDGCGTTDGHASLTFIPAATGAYRVRLWQDPCTVNATACGTIVVACNAIPIGIEEPGTDEPRLSLQPNPAHDLLMIASPILRGAAFAITDLSGRPVLHRTTALVDREVLDVSALPAGAYALHVIGAEGRRTSRLFVKE